MELLQTFTLPELGNIATNDIAKREGSAKPKVALSFELNRSHVLKLNKVSVDITETKIEEIIKKKDEKKAETPETPEADENDEA